MAPELPLLGTEWVRGGSAGPSTLSIDPSEVKCARPGTSTGPQSQLATLHLGGKTASLAGASIGQMFKQQRSSSEGTVQVLIARPTQSARRHLVARDLTAQAASSAAAQPVHAHALDKQTSALMHGERMEPADSLTAASKAAEAEEVEADPALRPATQAAKPTDSFSSAAAGVPQTVEALVPMTAQSLVSHHTGGGELAAPEGRERPATTVGGCTDAMPLTWLKTPINLSTALAAGERPASTHPGGGSSTLRSTLAPAAATMAHNQQLQGVVGAALARVASGPRPGNSSNSDNHRVIVGVKRKAAPAAGRPPMAPPTHQAGRTTPALTHAMPSASSAGVAQHPGTEATLTVEDAVSMVQQDFEVDAEVACDAVSQASADCGGIHGSLVEVEGRRLLVVRPGLSITSVGISKGNPRSN